jgi:hypothetical protein
MRAHHLFQTLDSSMLCAAGCGPPGCHEALLEQCSRGGEDQVTHLVQYQTNILVNSRSRGDQYSVAPDPVHRGFYLLEISVDGTYLAEKN